MGGTRSRAYSNSHMDTFAVSRSLGKSMCALVSVHCAGCGRLHRRPCHSALPAVATAGYKRVSCMPGVEALVRKQPLLQTLQVGVGACTCTWSMPCHGAARRMLGITAHARLHHRSGLRAERAMALPSARACIHAALEG